MLKRELTEAEKTLKDDSADRKKILKEVNNNLDGYSYKIIEYENKIKEYELMEIKYKNLNRESLEKEKIYEQKISILKDELEETKKEIVNVKKKIISNESKMSGIKSMLQLLAKEYGIAKIAEITEFKEEKIADYIKD